MASLRQPGSVLLSVLSERVPNKTVRVAIDARIKPGQSGGVGQALVSLIEGLGRLDDGSETYTIVVGSEEQIGWLEPHLGPRQEFALKPKPTKHRPGVLERMGASITRRLIGTMASPARVWPEVPVSDGFYESLGCDVIHFLNQLDFTMCAMPVVYNPHDLQHLHYPRFFTPAEIAKRETLYRAGCHFARTVVVGSQWVKDDVITQYGVNPDKVQVIPEHPPTQAYSKPLDEQLIEVKDKYKLEQPFIIYPAVTWEHKNHLRLLEAVAFLRDTYDLKVRLVCTGATYAFWPRIEARIDELQLSSQVQFLGFVPEEELRALYSLSQFLIVPTLFEASSLPIFEAWLEGTPVACSNITALPDQVLNAALMFDPNDFESIAAAIAEMTTNAKLRQDLRERGYRRLRDFDAERTAKSYRAVYRRAAGIRLSDEDRWLLGWDWMRNPERKMEVA